ncbi:MAG TPA: IS630 family transposase [Bradyrhizobium sp.]|uniref:IS630 family transposase n=1 Tax=Bradyrhizobium sp. TaxID=376 RepID=UPI002D7E190E|nr:IS630 family transposase [Bradyrhizobium sp.]HET7887631.1 IS630 family transposase [Bradyrhizobium sp.]
MGKPYSLDLRKRVVAAVVTGGLSCNQAAKQFGVGISTAIGWVRRQRETGSVAPGKMGGHRARAISGEHRVWVLERTKRDFTLRGLVAELAERGLKVDYRSVWEFVHAENLSFKKSVVAGERDRLDVARRRVQWIKYQNRVAPERLVFIDETWTRTDMAALRGWAPRGQRLTAKVPHGRWSTMTFLAALRCDRIEAPWFLEGPIDGDSFRLYVEKVLLPTLRPDDIVIMDNLGSHKGKVVRQLIRSAGARLFYLPKYSPDLNPIEQVFAKLKHFLRKAAARTIETVCLAIGEALQLFTPEECASYFANSGYGRT